MEYWENNRLFQLLPILLLYLNSLARFICFTINPILHYSITPFLRYSGSSFRLTNPLSSIALRNPIASLSAISGVTS